jgi:hypothetical protein
MRFSALERTTGIRAARPCAPGHCILAAEACAAPTDLQCGEDNCIFACLRCRCGNQRGTVLSNERAFCCQGAPAGQLQAGGTMLHALIRQQQANECWCGRLTGLHIPCKILDRGRGQLMSSTRGIPHMRYIFVHPGVVDHLGRAPCNSSITCVRFDCRNESHTGFPLFA